MNDVEIVRMFPFVPSGAHFEESLDFFRAIGFEVAWKSDDLAGLRFQGAYFLLQQIDIPEWQNNQMLVLEVGNLEQFYTRLVALNLQERFSGVAIRPPTDYPWGREVHLRDPAGVCWHVREASQ